MISAPNRRPPLSGSRRFLYLIIALIAAACSPKVRTVTVHPSTETEKAVRNQPKNGQNNTHATEVKVSTISLLLPFGLDHLAPGLSYSSVSLKKADIALDYYQGFKLALDSLTTQGYNYKLQVFDAKDDAKLANYLAYKPEIRTSDLIIGPVFPESIKAFTSVLTSARKPIVSPLSPASPDNFKNQNLITITPPLEYHARKAASYINNQIKPQKIFILKSGFSEENDYVLSFKKAIDSLSNKQIKVISITVIHGALASLKPQLSATETNVFVVPSTNQHFLTVTLRALDSLNNSYPVTLSGHPGWKNLTFLNVDILQRLNTIITTADQVNYKSANTITFIRSYRKAYHTEPSDYAIKGFDEGLYFGQILGADGIRTPEQTDFTGLHNDFHLIKKPGTGWVNTHVNVVKYVSFELKKLE